MAGRDGPTRLHSEETMSDRQAQAEQLIQAFHQWVFNDVQQYYLQGQEKLVALIVQALDAEAQAARQTCQYAIEQLIWEKLPGCHCLQTPETHNLNCPTYRLIEATRSAPLCQPGDGPA